MIEIKCLCRRCGEQLSVEATDIWGQTITVKVDRCRGCHDDLGDQYDGAVMRIAELEQRLEEDDEETRETGPGHPSDTERARA